MFVTHLFFQGVCPFLLREGLRSRLSNGLADQRFGECSSSSFASIRRHRRCAASRPYVAFEVVNDGHMRFAPAFQSGIPQEMKQGPAWALNASKKIR